MTRRRNVFLRIGLVLAIGLSAGHGAGDTIINPDGNTYDAHPSAAVLADGSAWIAWHSCDRDRDRVFARRIDPAGEPGPLHEVSADGGAVHGPPELAATADDVWVVWPACTGDHRWRIHARRFVVSLDRWDPIETVSDPAESAIYPAALALKGTRDLVVAWSGHRDGNFRIRCRRRSEDGSWSTPLEASPVEADAFRPVLAADEESGAVRVFWDQYLDSSQRYSVAGRGIHPEPTPLESLSPPGGDCLTPAALWTARGLFVAWLRKEDVIGGPGIISQMHTLHVARRTAEGTWELVRDAEGNGAGAHLAHGLMAKVSPKIVATGGYLGRRVAPMLCEERNRIWLMWERKSDHAASTPRALGDLAGRPIEEPGRWGTPVQLQTGLVDYRLPHPAVADTQGRVLFVASRLPREGRRLYELAKFDFGVAQSLSEEPWTGWRPVELPIAEEQPPRHEIRIGDEAYRLFWGDFHCHSGLTADAEGEPDELTRYARDRARLDAVAFTNNDFLYDVPLTGYEYALNSLFAHVESRHGQFISLPGYEWTSRVPGVAGISAGDPGNWTAPYQHKSFPNHRSVIYPAAGGPLVRFPDVGNDIGVLNDAVQRAGGITLTQHNAFLPSGHAVEVGMELTSGWGNYINEKPDLFYGPLNRGSRLAFVACGDTHRRAPGLSGALTGFYATDLSAEAVLDALRERRCFATAGAKVLIDARANGVFMGRDAAAPERTAILTLRAIGTRPIRSAVLIRDGREIASFQGTGEKEITFTHADDGLSSGTHWYYWEVRQDRPAPLWLPGNTAAAHGHLAWSTPNWVIVP